VVEKRLLSGWETVSNQLSSRNIANAMTYLFVIWELQVAVGYFAKVPKVPLLNPQISAQNAKKSDFSESRRHNIDF
jgi:hypothetical protein